MSGTPSNHSKKDPPFLHLKFASGRPPPHGHHLPFAHELQPDQIADLPESLKTDVQRKGIARWVEQNFKEGAYIWEVVHERKERDGMYGVVTKNWARSVGDPKLHLSIHVYQEDKHVATWHAYSDRSVSYSRAGDENDPPPTPRTGSDPYSTPEALAVSRSATPAVPLDDDDRPRFDRPAAAPDSEDDEALEEEAPFEPEEVSKAQTARDEAPSRSSKRGERAESPERVESSSAEEEPVERQRRKTERRDSSSSAESRPSSPERPASNRTSSRAARKPKPATPPAPSPTRSVSLSPERSPPPRRQQVDLLKPAYPIVKSKPLGKVSSHKDSTSSSRSRSRERIPPVRRAGETPAQPDSAESDAPVPRSTRDRSRRCPRSPEEARSATRRSRSRSPSPSPPRSPSTRLEVKADSTEKSHRSKAKQESASGEADHSVRAEKHRDRSRRRRRSRSRSPSPEADKKISPSKYHENKRSERRARPVVVDRSRSPSPTRADAKLARDGLAAAEEAQDHRGRRSKRRDKIDAAPTWRSVSRNRHRGDSSDNDTLVRGNLDDAGLDIPAGGEATLLKAKRRSSISEPKPRRPRRDESFDPEVVQQPPPEPVKQTATAVLGNWIKSVGTLLKQDVPSGEAVQDDGSGDEEEERRRRKAERAKRRAARAARRAAREAEEDSAREPVRQRSRHHESSGEEERSRRRHRSPERPPIRERAMSVSATLDSGIRSLRESVVKMVSGPAAEESAPPRDRSRRYEKSAAVAESDESAEEEERRKRRAKRASSRRRLEQDHDGEDRTARDRTTERRAEARPDNTGAMHHEAVKPREETPTLDEVPRRRAERRPMRAPSPEQPLEPQQPLRDQGQLDSVSQESDSSKRLDPVPAKPPKSSLRDPTASPASQSTRSMRQHTQSYKLMEADGPGQQRSVLPSRPPVFEAPRDVERTAGQRGEPAPLRHDVPVVTPDSPIKSALAYPPVPRPESRANSPLGQSFEPRRARHHQILAASASESDGESHRFEAAPAPVRQTRREDSVPPIPAPRYPTISPPYDARAPLRPEPIRPATTPLRPIEDRRLSLHATCSDPEHDHARYDRSAGPSPASTRHLPRSQSFSRSQPDFYPSSGVDDDSSSFESESERSDSRSRGGASTSEPDSLAFAPASGRGPSRFEGSSRLDSGLESGRERDRFSLSSGTAPMSGRQGRTMVGPPQSTREPLPREPPRFDDFAPEPKRGSRTMVSSRPLQNRTSTSTWRANDDAPFSARREPMQYGDDRRFDAMSASSSESPRLDSFVDRSLDYPLDSRDAYADRPTADLRDRDPQRAFDSMLRKGIESGSVQRFGKHGAPVSRRTAKRLGLQ